MLTEVAGHRPNTSPEKRAAASACMPGTTCW
jgi:hypothetical protein